jgi:tetratricopeptide (TPR) repeat protein
VEADLAFVVDVFLSSTSEDLKKYTDAVYQRLNKHEMFRCTHQRDFGARDAAAVNYCRERVLKAELYVGVFGMRRGWEPKGDSKKRSITEMEHDWAREAGKPRFLYVSPSSFSVPGDKPEPMTMHKRQTAFRNKVMGEGERLVSQRGFESPELLAAEIVSQLILHVATSGLIKMFRSDLTGHGPVSTDQGSVSPEEQRPAIAAAVERLAEDQDVDLLALAKNPTNVDLADLERKLTERAERHEAEGQTALKTSAEYWRHVGAMAFLHNTQKALASYEKAVSLDSLNPEGWRYLGELQYRLGELSNAERSFIRLRELGKSTDDLRIQSLGCVRLAWILEDRADLAQVEILVTDAVRFAEAAKWQEGLARGYVHLGNLHEKRGNLDQAEEMQRKAFALYEELGRKDGMGAACLNLGNIQETRGALDKAEEMQRKALALYGELGSKEGVARAYNNLGNIYKARGDLDQAEAMHRQALTLNGELGRKEGLAHAYLSLGNIHQIRGSFDKAGEMLRKALALYDELGSKDSMARAYGCLGVLSHSRGDKAAMCEFWRKERDLYREIGLPNEVAEVERWLRSEGCDNS